MKTTLLLFISTVFFLPSLIKKGDLHNSQQQIEKAMLVFDGYEGGYYFFTDENERAVTVRAESEAPVHNLDLVKNDLIGKRFEVTIDKSQIKKPVIPVQHIKYIIAANTP